MSKITIKWRGGTVFVGFCLMDIQGKRFLKDHEHDILAMKADPVFGRHDRKSPSLPGRGLCC